MLQGVGASTKGLCRFLRRHRRAVVMGSLVGLGAYGYYQAKNWWREAKALTTKLTQEAKEQRRYDYYLDRASRECMTAVNNFLPTLKKRLFAAVDVNGPVRELKLRRAALSRVEAGEVVEETESQAPPVPEFDLWERVKVSGITRLMVAMYSFVSLNLMLRLQLHILGRRSFDESLKFLRAAEAQDDESVEDMGKPKLSMEARHCLLAKTFEYLLGDGLLTLATDVDDAVSKTFVTWHCQHRVEVGSDEFIKKLSKVRREVEGHAMEAAQMPLLKYIIKPDDVLNVRAEDRKETTGKNAETTAAEDKSAEKAEEISEDKEEDQSCDQEGNSGSTSKALLYETWDAVESPNFSFALQDSLDAVFEHMCEQMRKNIFPPVQLQTMVEAPEEEEGEEEGGVEDDSVADNASGSEEDSLRRFEHLAEKRPTLATVVSQLKGVIADLLEPSEVNRYINIIAEQATLEDFCLSVFSRASDVANFPPSGKP